MSSALPTDDLRINGITDVTPPKDVHAEYPITETASSTVFETRQAIHNILSGVDDRMLIIVGPCSIHDVDAAMEYAGKLKALRDRVTDDLLIVMRVYFEKPRTTVGWKGLINDPKLDGSFAINEGLCTARKLLRDLNDMGLPTATEFLDLITPQYIADLISWGAIGARTTESQVHRELASGLSCPVGFKNGTDGTLKIAIDAIGAANRPHVFLSLTKDGHSAIFSTKGNEDCHVILRGGKHPNYDAQSIEEAAQALTGAEQRPNLMVDFSHANSQKQFERQIAVGGDVASQIASGDDRIMGAMIESHLVSGRQDICEDRSQMTYGQSITDPCLSWDETEPLLLELAAAVRRRRQLKSGNN